MSKQDTIISLLREIDKNIDNFGGGNVSKIKVRTFKVNNKCINDDGIWEGESLIDTSECTSFDDTFNNCTKMQILKAENWNTSKVTSMSSIFQGCNSLKELAIEDWNTQSLTSLQYAFMYVTYDKILDLTKWDTKNVNSIRSIFYGGNIDVVDISGWNGEKLGSSVSIASPFTGINTSIVGEKSIEYIIDNNICCLIGLKYSINPSFKSSINRASLRALINGLADLTGSDAQTLSLNATLIAKLTEEDIAIATAKNWTIA